MSIYFCSFFWLLGTAVCCCTESESDRWNAELLHSERLLNQGKYLEAEGLLKRLVAESASFQGNVARGGIASLHLAQVYQNRNRFKEAEGLLLRSAAAFDRAAASRDLRATPLVNLAYLYIDQKNYRKAEGAIQRASSLVAANSIVRASIMHLVGRLHYEKGHYGEAEVALQNAVDLLEAGQRYGEGAAALNNLAILYVGTNRLSDAIRFLERSVTFHEAAYGSTNPVLIRPLANLALAYKKTSRFNEADLLIKRALDLVRSSTSEQEHLFDLLTLRAEILRKTGNKQEAGQLAKLAASIRKEGVYQNTNHHTVDYVELLKADK